MANIINQPPTITLVQIPMSLATGGPGKLTGSYTWTNNTKGLNIESALAVLSAFSLSFGDNADHNVQTLGASVVASVSADKQSVQIIGTLQLQDNNEHYISPNGSALTAGLTVVLRSYG